MARTFRWAGPPDYPALGHAMFVAVRTGPSPYSQAQRAAWVPAPRSGPQWDERLAGQAIILAEEGGEIAGFMSLAEGGYIDFAFTVPRVRGTGLFRALFAHILSRARQLGVMRLRVHASLSAEPAFKALGFTVVRRERVAAGAQHLDRCEMELAL